MTSFPQVNRVRLDTVVASSDRLESWTMAITGKVVRSERTERADLGVVGDIDCKNPAEGAAVVVLFGKTPGPHSWSAFRA